MGRLNTAAFCRPKGEQATTKCQIMLNIIAASAAILDAVAAYSKIIAKQVLLGEGSSSRNLEDAGQEYLPREQTRIAQDGPGAPLLYRAINGFDRAQHSGILPAK